MFILKSVKEDSREYSVCVFVCVWLREWEIKRKRVNESEWEKEKEKGKEREQTRT